MKHILNDLSTEEKRNILGQYSVGIRITNENFNKLIENKLGTVNLLQEQQTEIPKVVNKISTEGLKNILPEMISSPPFKGKLSGYSFGGVFNGTDYQWDCANLDGDFPGIRGMVDIQIATDIIDNLGDSIGNYKINQITDGKPGTPYICSYTNNKSGRFIIYTATDNKPKIVLF